ncbi:MAG: hypothetical protein FRX49_00101 [Trebouxia sp. A1-2]|nr:MAG: hypothetical protein FRX49_00101 [Trebouxia sp. A1-2]
MGPKADAEGCSGATAVVLAVAGAAAAVAALEAAEPIVFPTAAAVGLNVAALLGAAGDSPARGIWLKTRWSGLVSSLPKDFNCTFLLTTFCHALGPLTLNPEPAGMTSLKNCLSFSALLALPWEGGKAADKPVPSQTAVKPKTKFPKIWTRTANQNPERRIAQAIG